MSPDDNRRAAVCFDSESVILHFEESPLHGLVASLSDEVIDEIGEIARHSFLEDDIIWERFTQAMGHALGVVLEERLGKKTADKIFYAVDMFPNKEYDI